MRESPVGGERYGARRGRERRRHHSARNVPQDVLQFEVARKISVSPAEIEAYYEEDTSEFTRPGDVTLREIVILEEPRGRNEARTLAEEIVARAAAGEDFAVLARELSEAPSREKGGLAGTFKQGDLAPVLEEQAFQLEVGEVGEPIATSYGFHIVKVETRTDTELTPLADVSDEIELKIRQQKYATDVEAYLKKLWNENLVIVNPRYAEGLLADGGPYVTRDQILPADATLGAPNPAVAGSSASPADLPSTPLDDVTGSPEPPVAPPAGTEIEPPVEMPAEDQGSPEETGDQPADPPESQAEPTEAEPAPEPPPDDPTSPGGSSGR